MTNDIKPKTMKEFLSAFDTKTLTTAGAVVIALALIYVVWDLEGNKLAQVANAVSKSQEDASAKQSQLIDVLLKNAQVIEGNTRVMEQVLRQR